MVRASGAGPRVLGQGGWNPKQQLFQVSNMNGPLPPSIFGLLTDTPPRGHPHRNFGHVKILKMDFQNKYIVGVFGILELLVGAPDGRGYRTNQYMAVSRSFLYIKLTPVVPIDCGMFFVQDLVCVMCGMKSVSCAGFSLCYVWA